MQDLFGLVVEVDDRCFSAIYGSGASSYWDAHGTMEAGKPVGVVAVDLPETTFRLLRQYAEQGGKVFVDSGAFGAFKKGVPVDFDQVLAIYDALLQGLTPAARRNFAVVMPDVIGEQVATMQLLMQYRDRILGFVAQGADVIISLQRGPRPVHDAAEDILVAIGTADVRFVIPSNAAALSDAELAKVRHHRFHILGKGTLDAKLRRRAYTLLEANPRADLTCDANFIRSRLDKVCKEHQSLLQEEGDPFSAVYDDTELLYAVLHDREWLYRSEIAQIAGLYGEADLVSIQRWLKAHRTEGLFDLVESRDPDCNYLWYMLPGLFSHSAKKLLSARLRSKAVAMALAA